jgi:hypothetical protein
VGFNPFRSQRKTPADVAIVVGFIVIVIVLVLWGFFG